MANPHHENHDDHHHGDHHGDDHHHHQGPVIVTELVPEKSGEDFALFSAAVAGYAILSLCFVFWFTMPELDVAPSLEHGAGHAEHAEQAEH